MNFIVYINLGGKFGLRVVLIISYSNKIYMWISRIPSFVVCTYCYTYLTIVFLLASLKQVYKNISSHAYLRSTLATADSEIWILNGSKKSVYFFNWFKEFVD
uniref:hypothetical protein n=1 Tax=Clostridium haemolyticum TaxID=84025 RepID=UPI001E5AAB41|nr:hypothetical protein [Clostridium haemolyticum]